MSQIQSRESPRADHAGGPPIHSLVIKTDRNDYMPAIVAQVNSLTDTFLKPRNEIETVLAHNEDLEELCADVDYGQAWKETRSDQED